jgi:hypothetical protein
MTSGNAYVVDGSIRTSGERVRVAARLLSPGGEVLWSQTFNRNLVDLFEVQELIAASVADALSVSLDVGTNSTTYGGTSNPEAFAAYLQSRAHMFDPDQSVPVDYAEQALAFDPHYGKAFSLLATILGIQVNTADRAQAGALLAKIDDLTARAIAANPNLPSGHLAREYYYLQVRDYPPRNGASVERRNSTTAKTPSCEAISPSPRCSWAARARLSRYTSRMR